MGIITKPFPDFVALTTAEAAKVNAVINALYTLVNGEISDPNISAIANINQNKILNLTADLNTIRAERVMEVNVLSFQNSGNYTKPTDLRFARIIAIGGGGGGAGAQSTVGGAISAGGGGGGGSYSEAWIMASTINPIEVVTIGLGGGAGGYPGGNGGNTSFGALVVAPGGSGGTGQNDSIGQGGQGNSGGAGQILITGERGESGFLTNSPFAIAKAGSGGGMGPYMIRGIALSVGGNQGGSAGGLGGGGSGAVAIGAGQSVAGGAGGNGIVIVVEFKA